MSTKPSGPDWNLNTIYKDFSDSSFISDTEKLENEMKLLQNHAENKENAKSETLVWFKTAVEKYNRVSDLFENLLSFAYCRFSTNTKDKDAIQYLSKIEEYQVPLNKSLVILRNTMAEIKEILQKNPDNDALIKKYSFFINEQLFFQQHQMDAEKEELAQEMLRSGGELWTKLQEAVSSSAKIVWDEKTKEKKTVVQLRAMAYDNNREIRKKAFEKELEVIKNNETALAYALNGVKGSAITLNKQRNYKSALEKSTFQARINDKTLNALISSMEKTLPMFREYYKAKASYLGATDFGFYDLFAPISSDTKVWTYDQAKEFILEQFYSFSKELGDFAANAFKADWLDIPPKDGKVGGAYCISFPLTGESRILSNFDGSFSSITTIAHELGHAFHHHVLKDSPAIDREYPMTLAETASIFCENVVFNRALDTLADKDRLAVLDVFLMEAGQIIVDILSRFKFEQNVFEKRRKTELTAEDFCTLMLQAQKDTYGDALDSDSLHPYMWAVKSHYYSTDLAFYNFPYAFGMLFGIGLYSEYKKDKNDFPEKYNKMLRNTGRADAVSITKDAGFNIETEDFWLSGLKLIQEKISEFISLTK